MTVQLQITDDPAELAAKLARLRGVIVFDGCPGAGKSTLARDMAERLRCKEVDVDDFVEKERGVYVASVRTSEALARINAELDKAERVIFASVCARDVVDRLGVFAATFVYVQRVSSSGSPGDPDMLTAEEGGPLDRPYFTDLDRELAAYHAHHHPVANASILYRRSTQ